MRENSKAQETYSTLEIAKILAKEIKNCPRDRLFNFSYRNDKIFTFELASPGGVVFFLSDTFGDVMLEMEYNTTFLSIPTDDRIRRRTWGFNPRMRINIYFLKEKRSLKQFKSRGYLKRVTDYWCQNSDEAITLNITRESNFFKTDERVFKKYMTREEASDDCPNYEELKKLHLFMLHISYRINRLELRAPQRLQRYKEYLKTKPRVDTTQKWLLECKKQEEIEHIIREELS